MELKDKVVIVTGSGRGIGQAIALKFGEQQSRVAVVDRNKDRALETVKMVEKAGSKALALSTDVTDFSQVQEMVARTTEVLGEIDILVNNAGWSVLRPFMDLPMDLWDPIIDLNLKACLYCCRAVSDIMTKNRKGKIINVSSDAGRIGSPDESIYAAAKGGVIAFTKSLAGSLAPWNINVNCVCPGPTDTPMVRKGIEMNEMIATEMKKREQAIPLKRYAQPDEIADAVLFFASDAAKYITGQILSVSGGATMVG